MWGRADAALGARSTEQVRKECKATSLLATRARKAATFFRTMDPTIADRATRTGLPTPTPTSKQRRTLWAKFVTINLTTLAQHQRPASLIAFATLAMLHTQITMQSTAQVQLGPIPT